MKTEKQQTLGERIKAAREAADLSQQAAANAMGVTMMSWSRWERGQHEPDLTTLRQIAKLLGIEVAALVGD